MLNRTLSEAILMYTPYRECVYMHTQSDPVKDEGRFVLLGSLSTNWMVGPVAALTESLL